MSTSAWSQPSDALINNLKQSSQQQQGTSQQQPQNTDAPQRKPTQQQGKKKKVTGNTGKPVRKEGKENGEKTTTTTARSGTKITVKESTALFEKLNAKSQQASERGPFIFTDKGGFESRGTNGAFFSKKKPFVPQTVRFEEELARFGVIMSAPPARGERRERRERPQAQQQ